MGGGHDRASELLREASACEERDHDYANVAALLADATAAAPTDPSLWLLRLLVEARIGHWPEAIEYPVWESRRSMKEKEICVASSPASIAAIRSAERPHG